MKQYFELEKKEKTQEWLLLALAILFFIIIGLGIYYQSSNSNHDNILTPLFFTVGGSFFLIYGLNAFGKRNLIRKWTPPYVFAIPSFFLKKLFPGPERAKGFAVKFVGIIGLAISAVSFAVAFISIVKH